ncbi:MAG: DNA gyrase inhibitor YacG [Bradymonadia bacterium]
MPKTRRCRICGGPVPPKTPPENNTYWPLCSERCHMVDLDHWLTGDYVISRPLLPGAATAPGAGNQEDSEEP